MAHQGNNDWTKVKIATHPGSEMAGGGSGALYTSDTFWFGMGFAVTEDCSLTGAAFDLNAVTGTPPLYKMELWPLDPDAMSDPDMSGTVLAETANLNFAGATLGRQEHAFSSPYSATKGQKLFIFVKYVSGSYDASNRIVIGHSSGKPDNMDFPFVSYTVNSGGSWTQDDHDCPNYAVVTNKNYDLGVAFAVGNEQPHAQTGAHILDTAGDRVCNEMIFPSSDKPLEMSVCGFRYIGKGPQALDNHRVGVWNAAGTLLGGSDIFVNEAGDLPGTNDGWIQHYFDDDVTVSSGDTIYIGFERLAATFDLTRVKVSSLAYPDDLVAALRGFRVWPFSSNCIMKVWDESDGTPAWKHDTVDPYARLLLDPIINDMHGKYAEAEGCPVSRIGKGSDVGERAPGRVKQIGKPGYQVNAVKLIQREGHIFGWDPYNPYS